MAASIRDSRLNLNDKKPVLIDRIEIAETDLNAAQILPDENGFISIADDKYALINVRIDKIILTGFN